MGATDFALCVMDLDGHRGNVLTLPSVPLNWLSPVVPLLCL